MVRKSSCTMAALKVRAGRTRATDQQGGARNDPQDTYSERESQYGILYTYRCFALFRIYDDDDIHIYIAHSGNVVRLQFTFIWKRDYFKHHHHRFTSNVGYIYLGSLSCRRHVSIATLSLSSVKRYKSWKFMKVRGQFPTIDTDGF